MISPIQNNNYGQAFTGSIKMNPAMHAVEKHLQKTPKHLEQSFALEFYNFIRQIKGDNTGNTLIVTTSKRLLPTPAVVTIEDGSTTRTKTLSQYTVTKVKYGDVVREYSGEIHDTPSFRTNLGCTIKHNLIEFGKELFGERSLTEFSTKNLQEYNRLAKRTSRILKDVDGILEQLKTPNINDIMDYHKYKKLVKEATKKQSIASQLNAECKKVLEEGFYELSQLTLDLLK